MKFSLQRPPLLMESTPAQERPRERCLESGTSCLSLRECLALILGSGPPGVGCMGLATQILNRIGTGLSPEDEERAFFTSMEISGAAHLQGLSGLGPSGQSKILAAFELARRYLIFHSQSSLKPQEKEKEKSSPFALQALAQIPKKLRTETREWLGFVPLYAAAHLGGLCLVERGARTHVNVDPGELFARILVLRPRGFFLFHNHPSGIMTPSIQDIDLTHRVAEISRPFNIQLLGHGIVAAQNECWIHPELFYS